MDSDSTQAVRLRPYRPFLPLFFSLAGWALLHVWLYLMTANYRAHSVALVLGTAFSAWSVFPLPRMRSAHTGNMPSMTSGRTVAAVPSTLHLLLGAILGGLVIYGSLLLLGLGAAVLNFLPWRRQTSGQQPLALPCLLACCGFGLVLFAGRHTLDVMFLPLAAWAFWTATLVGLIWRTARSRTAARSKGISGNTATVPTACET